MGKSKTKSGEASNQASKTSQPHQTNTTLDDIHAQPDLLYKIKVLLHDLHNIKDDRAAESRIGRVTDSLYISAPYFTASEADLIKSTMISPPTLTEVPEFEELDVEGEADVDADTAATTSTSPRSGTSAQEETVTASMESAERLVTIEEAINNLFQNFFEKRKASGDARPCGPHDMGPVYRAVFGITKEDLADAKFLGRLRRAGLECAVPVVKDDGAGKKKKGGGKR